MLMVEMAPHKGLGFFFFVDVDDGGGITERFRHFFCLMLMVEVKATSQLVDFPIISYWYNLAFFSLVCVSHNLHKQHI